MQPCNLFQAIISTFLLESELEPACFTAVLSTVIILRKPAHLFLHVCLNRDVMQKHWLNFFAPLMVFFFNVSNNC